jgi:hypothetical protein
MILVSQYADDTTVILDGTTQSLELVIATLNTFQQMCGLKVNNQKTSAVWIGSNRGNKLPICTNLNLFWKFNGVFEMLGVTFCTKLKDMVNMNYMKALFSIKTTIAMWSKRSLTVFGKVTVIKAFILAKLNYIGQMLPNPSDEYLKEVNECIFKFIWNGKPDKIKRSQIIQDYCFGGVRVPHVSSHLNALKINWLRRVELGDEKWVQLFHLVSNLQKNDIYEFGLNRWRKISHQIKNCFWNDVLHAWAIVIRSYYCDNNLDFNCIARNYLWWNDKIRVGNQSVKYTHWYNKGVVFVNDLLKPSGGFFSFLEFRKVYDINIHAIEYYGIINSIKSKWSCIGKGSIKVVQPFKPMVFDLLLGSRKGCKRFYELLLTNVKTSCNSPIKWQNELGTSIHQKEWQNLCCQPMKITKDTKLHWFQFRIINHILGTNMLLCKMKIKDNNLCSFCNAEVETILHLLYQCNTVTLFWDNFKLWISSKIAPLSRNFHMTPKIIILGTFGDTAFNLILLLAKFHIYRARMQNTKPNIFAFRCELRFYVNVEKCTAIRNGSLRQYNLKWDNWKSLL